MVVFWPLRPGFVILLVRHYYMLAYVYPHPVDVPWIFALWICPICQTFETVSASKIYYIAYNEETDTRYIAPNGEQRTSNETKQFDVGEGRSGEIRNAENLSDNAFDILRGTIDGRRCTSVSSPYHFACGGDHQPCLQSEVLCLNEGERFLPQTEVRVGLEE